MSAVPAVGDAAPKKSARDQCWAARDAYFACLDEHHLWLHGLDPKTHEEKVAIDSARYKVASESDRSLSRQEKARLFLCKQAKTFFSQHCLPSWAEYFESNRVKEIQKKYLIERLKSSESERLNQQDEFWKRVSSSATDEAQK